MTTNDTATILQNMLTENTGRSILDSGDAYGRNWERNQGRDFENEAEAELEVGSWGLIPTLNVYHWLKERLEYCPEMTEAMEEYGRENDLWGLQLMEAWCEDAYPDATGLWGNRTPFTINTYNGESVLSQVLQYHYFEIDGGGYIALQIHGGCDVRGGYTDPKVFKIIDPDDLILAAEAGLYCDNCEARWHTDNAGNHWYPNNDEGVFEIVTSDDLEEGEEFGNGKAVIFEGEAYCPCCGKGKLHASVY
jgi:hypothetical protein